MKITIKCDDRKICGHGSLTPQEALEILGVEVDAKTIEVVIEKAASDDKAARLNENL